MNFQINNCFIAYAFAIFIAGLIHNVQSSWGSWSNWSDCSATCGGGGLKYQYRRCYPDYCDCYYYYTSTIRTQNCFVKHCPVDGKWGSWTFWSCSVTCGDGTKRRSRNCNNPSPAYSGLNCSGSRTESDRCSAHPCPVNGMWGYWSSYTSCSVSCGGGFYIRTRNCDNPSPAHNGLYCSGSPIEKRDCNSDICPVHGNWGTWSIWTSCNVTCGEGFQNRTRECDNPATAFGGRDCTDTSTEIYSCFSGICPAKEKTSVGLVAGVAVISAFLPVCIVIAIYLLRTRTDVFEKCTKPERREDVGVTRKGFENIEYIHSNEAVNNTHSVVYENLQIR